jgi:FMN-dependent NADH-azoreductase
MPTLLRIDVSPRGAYSVSKTLADSAAKAWLAKHPDGKIITRDLSQGGPLPFVDLPWIMGAYTPAEQHSSETAAAIKVSNDLVAELFSADEILLSTPMYNFSLPAALKAYLDHVVRMGRTVSRTYQGLVTGKKIFIIVASAGSYELGTPAADRNFFTGYMDFILNLMGLTDHTIHFVSGTSAINMGQTTLEDFVKQHEPKVIADFLN